MTREHESMKITKWIYKNKIGRIKETNKLYGEASWDQQQQGAIFSSMSKGTWGKEVIRNWRELLLQL